MAEEEARKKAGIDFSKNEFTVLNYFRGTW